MWQTAVWGVSQHLIKVFFFLESCHLQACVGDTEVLAMGWPHPTLRFASTFFQALAWRSVWRHISFSKNWPSRLAVHCLWQLHRNLIDSCVYLVVQVVTEIGLEHRSCYEFSLTANQGICALWLCAPAKVWLLIILARSIFQSGFQALLC